MPTFRTTRVVPHPAGKMFDLVADVEQYPKFVPLCQSLRVTQRSILPDGREVVLANMRVGYKAIRESFTSKVTLDRPRLLIATEYVDGPFRALENRWTFRDNPGGGSTIEFFITYEFRSRTFGMLMGSMFDAAFRRFAEAFEHRAHEVYG